MYVRIHVALPFPFLLHLLLVCALVLHVDCMEELQTFGGTHGCTRKESVSPVKVTSAVRSLVANQALGCCGSS